MFHPEYARRRCSDRCGESNARSRSSTAYPGHRCDSVPLSDRDVCSQNRVRSTRSRVPTELDQPKPKSSHEVLIVAFDITGIKLHHEEADREQARLKFIFDYVPVGISL